MLNETLRSRWFAASLHAGLWLLLILAAASIGGGALGFHEAEIHQAAVNTPVPVAKLGALFSQDNWPEHVVATNLPSPFATTHFIPPVVPVVPPTTKTVALTYQGFYQAADGPRHAMLLVDQKIQGIPVGGMIVTNLFLADAEFKTAVLTNSAMQTNVLALNVKSNVLVPLK